MARKSPFETAYINDPKMERCFQRIFVKQRRFCSPDTGKPEVSKLPSFILIEGGFMILHEEAFQEDLKDAWKSCDQSSDTDEKP